VNDPCQSFKNPKHERVARELAKGGSAAQAYAGWSVRNQQCAISMKCSHSRTMATFCILWFAQLRRCVPSNWPLLHWIVGEQKQYLRPRSFQQLSAAVLGRGRGRTAEVVCICSYCWPFWTPPVLSLQIIGLFGLNDATTWTLHADRRGHRRVFTEGACADAATYLATAGSRLIAGIESVARSAVRTETAPCDSLVSDGR
jgi:hypothetical protein